MFVKVVIIIELMLLENKIFIWVFLCCIFNRDVKLFVLEVIFEEKLEVIELLLDFGRF